MGCVLGGLLILSKHAGLFIHHLHQDYVHVHTMLQKLITHVNRETSHLAFKALEAFVLTMPEVIMQLTETDQEKAQSIFKVNNFSLMHKTSVIGLLKYHKKSFHKVNGI